MSIRTRLLLYYAAMLIVPIVLFIAAAMLLALVFIGDIREAANFYNFNLRNHQEVRDQIRQHSTIVYNLRYLADNQPERLQDVAYLKQLDAQLSRNHSGIVYRQADQWVFVSPSLQQSNVIKQLPSFAGDSEDKGNALKVGSHFYTYSQFNFYSTDHQPASVFVVTDASPMAELAREFFPLLSGLLLLILIVTNGFLTYLVSRGIIRPLHKLKRAAEEIKEGNLDFELSVTSKDEIGQVSQTFEEMRRKLKESIELQLQYEENRKELISNISHDLKSPITTIKGYIEGLRDGVADTPEKMHKYMDTIAAKTTDLDRLIDELFLFSRLDLKRLPFHFEVIDIGRYLSDLIEELQFDIEKRGVTIRNHVQLQEVVPVTADREKIKRVIQNILDNSLKYLDKPEKRLDISLVSEPKSSEVLLKIEDNGVGIEAEFVGRIFERFYRVDSARNPTQSGTGLGLAIAKEIIEGHGGRIWAESQVGQGTVIWIALPKYEDRAGEIG